MCTLQFFNCNFSNFYIVILKKVTNKYIFVHKEASVCSQMSVFSLTVSFSVQKTLTVSQNVSPKRLKIKQVFSALHSSIPELQETKFFSLTGSLTIRGNLKRTDLLHVIFQLLFITLLCRKTIKTVVLPPKKLKCLMEDDTWWNNNKPSVIGENGSSVASLSRPGYRGNRRQSLWLVAGQHHVKVAGCLSVACINEITAEEGARRQGEKELVAHGDQSGGRLVTGDTTDRPRERERAGNMKAARQQRVSGGEGLFM